MVSERKSLVTRDWVPVMASTQTRFVSNDMLERLSSFISVGMEQIFEASCMVPDSVIINRYGTTVDIIRRFTSMSLEDQAWHLRHRLS